MTQSYQLSRQSNRKPNDAKVLIVVLDGVGIQNPPSNISTALNNDSQQLPAQAFTVGNAVNAAYTPNLAKLCASPDFRTLLAHGPSVGLPSEEDMGNSEVGHNALGAGRVFAQGAKLVNAAIESGALFRSQAWGSLVERASIQNGKNTLHLMGLFSDGNVHSHIDHLFALIEGAKRAGVKQVRLHLLLDGRDVGPKTALDYVDRLDTVLAKLNSADFDCKVASGGGRMLVTMDRYESDWSIVERGYHAHVLGEGRAFSSMREAIETYRRETDIVDQNMPAFVIAHEGKPIGTIEDHDSVILFNFRGDRAIQISRALTESEFQAFPRKRFPQIQYAGMMQYDGDLKIPETFLVTPPTIENTMGELLAHAGVKQFACSETQKYGHVTYFWNGNRSGKFDATNETYVEIPSDRVPFVERPWMKCAEIADATIAAMRENSFAVGRINFANGDMVGHSGNFDATLVSMCAVDLQLGRIMETARETNTILIVTADHGNADEMYELNKKTGAVALDPQGRKKLKTSHTLAPVPFAIFNAEILPADFALRSDLPRAGLANIASTTLELAGFVAPDFYEPSLLTWGQKKKS